jgi:hypothetical protein
LIPDGVVRQGAFDRFFIFHETNDLLGWSGLRWVSCTPEGVPTPPDNVQVCNFASFAEAAEYEPTKSADQKLTAAACQHFIHRLNEFLRVHPAETYSSEAEGAAAFFGWLGERDKNL